MNGFLLLVVLTVALWDVPEAVRSAAMAPIGEDFAFPSTTSSRISQPGKDFGSREAIVEDGKVTDFGKEKFGGRLSFSDGKLKIANLKKEDLGLYFFEKRGQEEEAIELLEEHRLHVNN